MQFPDNDNYLVLFDGVCVLCSNAVRFIIRFDGKDLFRFAAIQNDTGKRILNEYNFTDDFPGTVVLIEKGKFYIHSTAILRIIRRLSGGWPLFYALIIIPVPVRDFFYKFVAKKRYRWFGKYKTCMIPDKNLESRFVDHIPYDK